MEIETISKITLDLYAKNIVSISAKQYDNKTRFVEITCVENGIIFQVDKLTMSAFIRFKKPDDNGVFNEVEVTSDGKLKIELTEQMLSASGRAIADVFLLRKVFTSEEKPTNIDDIYKVNAPIISIMDFYINITPTALNHSQIESSYEFNALTNALAQIDYNNKKVVELDKTLTGNENIRKNNESTRQNNEQARINSENQRINAENIRNTSEDKRTKSENERIKQENIRNTSEQQRISSENNRITNENDRKTNENIRKSNESQRQTNETNRISSEDKRLSSETDRQSNETTRQKNESTRQTSENTRISNETDRANAEAERVKNEITRISNENTRNTQETKRQADTATAITNANNAAKNANDKANDLQNKLDNHHFVLTNELENSVSSTSTTHAPTANAVKTAYDKAVSVENTINSNKNNWNDKYTRNEIDNKFSTLENNIDWKESVSTYTDIAKTYPNPQDGWTVNVKDTDYTYRYSGTSWVTISANAIPKATQSVDGLLSKEDKTNYDDTNSKKHTHSNKSVLDGITSALVTTWNTVTNKLDKTGDASNVTNTITTASTRVNLSTGEKLSISLGKIAKWFSDLKTVAFSGSYNDLSNKPSSMPANGGNATTVNGHTVNSDVPANAKFTDTNTWRGIQNNLTSDSTSDSLSAAQGKALKTLIDTKTSNTGTLTGIKMNGVSKGTSGVVDLGTVLTSGKQTATSTADGGSNVYTFSDGSTITVKNGTKGSTGATGSPGAAGKNGSNGTSAAWFTGIAVTGTATSAMAFTVSGSKAGDMYLNTSTYNVYRASAANSWVYVCNIKGATGAKGADGKNGTNGTNATATATGSSSTAGLTKLYTGTGTATDGTMTQNAIKSALDGKANSSHTHSQYLTSHQDISGKVNKSGDTLSGRITRSGGGSWISDRNNVAVFGTSSASGNYNPIVGQKTPNGSWTIGNLANSDHLVFNYTTDTNYNAGNNVSTAINLPNVAGTIALTSQIPSVGNGTVTITQNGAIKGTFTMNQSGNTTIALTDTNTDTNTWRPLGTTADTACAGNDSRLSNARPASDVYAWAKASTKPSYSWGEITGKPSTFTPASHTHNYAGSSSAGGAANKAIGVVDYNDSNRTIKIGYTGDSLKSSEIGFIAGYANINSSTCIKDISKDQLLAWLGLNSLITTGYNDTMWSTASGNMYYYIKFSTGIMIMVTIVPDGWGSNDFVYTYPVSFINNRYALIAVDNTSNSGQTNYHSFDRRIPYLWYTKSSFQIYTDSPVSDFYNEGMDDSMSVICIGRWK